VPSIAPDSPFAAVSSSGVRDRLGTSDPCAGRVIDSAVANARVKSPNVDVDKLYVKTAFVDKGPNRHMRRWRPRAMGRATRVTKGISHITIILDER